MVKSGEYHSALLVMGGSITTLYLNCVTEDTETARLLGVRSIYPFSFLVFQFREARGSWSLFQLS